MNPEQFEALCERITKKETAIAKDNTLLKELTAKRREHCPHTDLEPKEFYFSGSYNDTAYTEYWNRCKCCGAESERTSERHSWYG